METDSCTNLARWNTCGDLKLYTTVTDALNPNPLEECDDGNLVDGDGCTGCRLDPAE